MASPAAAGPSSHAAWLTAYEHYAQEYYKRHFREHLEAQRRAAEEEEEDEEDEEEEDEDETARSRKDMAAEAAAKEAARKKAAAAATARHASPATQKTFTLEEFQRQTRTGLAKPHPYTLPSSFPGVAAAAAKKEPLPVPQAHDVQEDVATSGAGAETAGGSSEGSGLDFGSSDRPTPIPPVLGGHKPVRVEAPAEPAAKRALGASNPTPPTAEAARASGSSSSAASASASSSSSSDSSDSAGGSSVPSDSSGKYVNPVLGCILANCSANYLRCISNSGCSDVFECLQSDTSMEKCVKFHDSLSPADQATFAALGRCEDKHDCFSKAPASSDEFPAQGAAASSSSSSSSSGDSSGGASDSGGGDGDGSESSDTSDTSDGDDDDDDDSESSESAAAAGSSSAGSDSSSSSSSSSRGPPRPKSCDSLCEQQCDLSAQIKGTGDTMPCRRSCTVTCFRTRYIISL